MTTATPPPEPLSASQSPQPQPPAAADPSAPRHFGFVDALRGLAILGVVVIHVSLRLPNFHGRLRGAAAQGQFGVQLFFVVSAFTLFWSLRSRSSKERRPLLAFYFRRVFRIVPLFWAGALFYLVWPYLDRPGYAPAGVHWPQVVATLLLVHGWWPTSVNTVVPGGWSIAAEAMFYLCIPFLYHRVRTLNAALWLSLVSAVLVGGLSSPVARHIARHFPPSYGPLVDNFVFYSFPSQFPVFCLGMVLYFLLAEPDPSRNKAGGGLLVAAALALLFAPLPKHVVPSATFVVLAAGLAERPVWLLVNPVTRFAGTVSFSGYIWHFWVLDHLGARTAALATAHHLNPTLQFCAVYAAVIAVTFPIATASYYLIEVPGQGLGKRLINRMGWGKRPDARAA